MGFSLSDSQVRIDRFKPSGKWYDTYELEMRDFWDAPTGPHEAVKQAMIKAGIKPLAYDDSSRSLGSFIVCLEPYHRNAYPVILWESDFK